MKLLDVNLLVYATNRDLPQFGRVSTWFEDLMNSGERVGMPWHSLVGFVRVSTQPALKNPLEMDLALQFVEEWLEWDSVWTPSPTTRHVPILAELLRQVPRSKTVPDAHLAALAIEHGLTLCSADADFRRFNGLQLFNPLDP
ncbi:MAG: TA system VapC family ribonuclease toxin [Vicinamibacterales bacterium]